VDCTCRDDKARLWSTEPPKVVADIVEAIVGAVHVDGGFHEGQLAALSILSPIFDLLKSLDDPLVISSNPKREFLEMTGRRLVSVQSMTVTGNHDMQGVSSEMTCFGKTIFRLDGCTSLHAHQRVCELCMEVLRQNKTLLERFTTVRSHLDKEVGEIRKTAVKR
jgi:dsRNA-specific ribonuclease